MREIEITSECLDFIDSQPKRVALKFFQLIEILGELKVIHSNFLKKVQSTQFYELRITAGNEYRVLIFAIDHENFSACTKAICLCGFQKKSTKDYSKAIDRADRILENYIK